MIFRKEEVKDFPTNDFFADIWFLSGNGVWKAGTINVTLLQIYINVKIVHTFKEDAKKRKGTNDQSIDWNKNHLFCRHCMCITESCPTRSMLKVGHFKRGPSTLLRFKIYYCFSSARSKHLQIFVKSPELMPIVRLIPMKVVAKRISIWKHYWADIHLQRRWQRLQRWGW